MDIIYMPNTGENWANAHTANTYARKGGMGLSLTGFDTASAPLVADGSWCEVAGSVYNADSDESVSGTPATGTMYIKMVPSGSTAAAIVTPTWTATVPTWSDSYQGWYIGTSRIIGGCVFDGSDYDDKFIYQKRLKITAEGIDLYFEELPDDTSYENAQTSYHAVSLVGDSGSGWTYEGTGIDVASPGDDSLLPVNLPHGAIVTQFSCWCGAYTQGSVSISLRRSYHPDGTEATLAIVTLDAIELQTDSSISNATIDNNSYSYFIRLDPSPNPILTLRGIRITYTYTKP